LREALYISMADNTQSIKTLQDCVNVKSKYAKQYATVFYNIILPNVMHLKYFLPMKLFI